MSVGASTGRQSTHPRLRGLTWRLAFSVALWVLMVVAYAAILSTSSGERAATYAVERIQSENALGRSLAIYSVALALSLLLPFSPATILVLAGVTLFGPTTTFLTSLAAATTSTSIAYWVGRSLAAYAPHVRIRAAISFLAPFARRTRLTWAVIFLGRAIPNPIYDAWGYAAGIVGVPFGLYLSASVAGGVIPLALLCHIGARVS